jgi:hypothetical protein
MHRVERLASLPAMGYPLLLAWQKGWLPTPSGVARARLIALKKSGSTPRSGLQRFAPPSEITNVLAGREPT